MENEEMSIPEGKLYEDKDKDSRLIELIEDCMYRISYYERALLKERDTLCHLYHVQKILKTEEKKDEKV